MIQEQEFLPHYPMLCPQCADNGKEVEMAHVRGNKVYTDPGAIDGVSEIETCGYFCNVCTYADECDGNHKDDPEPSDDR